MVIADKPGSFCHFVQLEYRSAQAYSGGHSDDVDYASWNPTHPELFCTSSQRDRRIVFWDARREFSSNISCTSLSSNDLIVRKSFYPTVCSESSAIIHSVCPERTIFVVCHRGSTADVLVLR